MSSRYLTEIFPGLLQWDLLFSLLKHLLLNLTLDRLRGNTSGTSKLLPLLKSCARNLAPSDYNEKQKKT